MKYIFFVFLFLTSFSFFGQKIEGTIGFKNYSNPHNGFEVDIEVKYQLRVGVDDLMLRTSFATRPARGGKRLYYLNGKPYDLVRLDIPINYNKFKLVDAVIYVLIGGSSKEVNITSITNKFTGAGISLCSELKFNREKCREHQKNLNFTHAKVTSVKVDTRDYDIEGKIRSWLNKNNGRDNDNGGGNVKDDKLAPTTYKNKSSNTYPISKSDFLVEGNNKTNNSNSKSNIQSSSKSIEGKKFKQYANSAEENFSKGNYSESLIALNLQKANTSNPTELRKIESNIDLVNSMQQYTTYESEVKATQARNDFLDKESANFMSEIDAASNGNELMAGSQKLGYFIGSAAGGRFDTNSFVGAATDFIGHFSEKKREKEALEAQKRAIKQKIEEEK